MSEETGRPDGFIDELKQHRDELAVQIHLGKMEAKEEWARLEEKWEKLQSYRGPIGDVADETAKNALAAAKLAAEELQHGYAKLREILKG